MVDDNDDMIAVAAVALPRREGEEIATRTASAMDVTPSRSVGIVHEGGKLNELIDIKNKLFFH